MSPASDERAPVTTQHTADAPEWAIWCPRCGGALDPAAGADHSRCGDALVLEPPRFCTRCRRRMVVQVVPTGWTARCSEHGEVRPSV